MSRELELQYYREREPEKRQKILEYMISEGQNPDDDRLRKEIFDTRYVYRSKMLADEYLRFWIILRMYSLMDLNTRQTNKARKAVQKEMKKLHLEEIKGKNPHIAYQEFYHLAALYIKTCQEDKNYGKVFFGIVNSRAENTEKKLKADVLETGVFVPKRLGLDKELDVFIQGVKDAYRDAFAEEEDFLSRYIRDKEA